MSQTMLKMLINKKTPTLGSDAKTCCFTSQTRRSDGNCKHLYTFNSGTCIRTRSHPSFGSGGESSSKTEEFSIVIYENWLLVCLIVVGWYIRCPSSYGIDENWLVVENCHYEQSMCAEIVVHFMVEDLSATKIEKTKYYQ